MFTFPRVPSAFIPLSEPSYVAACAVDFEILFNITR